MSSSDASPWYPAAADSDGWVTWASLQRAASGVSREAFLSEYPAPVLYCLYGSDNEGGGMVDPHDSGVQLVTTTISGASMLRYLGKAAFVVKRPGNAFAHLISIGRSTNNDIRIAVESVSKVHGYLTREGDATRFTDHGSTNGSFWNGEPIEHRSQLVLEPGGVLQLGPSMFLEYLDPDALWRRLTHA